MAWRAWAALAMVAVGTGCTFKDGIAAGQVITCEVGKEACPTGSTCRAALGRCVDDALLNLPAATPVGAQLTPAIGNAHATFQLDFQVTRPLDRPPTAVALGFPPETFPFACSACGADLRCHCAWAVDAAHRPPEGPVAVAVSLLDEAGNAPAAVTVGTVTFDSLPPRLIAPPSVTLQAPADALAPVSRLGNGVQAEVCFVVSEALSGPPQVWAGAEDAGLAFAPSLGTPQGQRWCFQATLDGRVAAADGPLAVQTRVSDVAGNVAVLPLASGDGGALLDVDRTPPTAPDLSEATGLRYHRAPWGELPTIGTPRLEVVSGGATQAEPGTVIAYADAEATLELGRARLEAGAAIHVPLSADSPEVFVQVVDAAGNALAGGPVRVRNVDWVLNLGRKVAGDVLANPHDCYARAQAGASLLQHDDRRTALDAERGPNGIGTDGGGTHLSGAGGWRQRTSALSDAPDLFYAFDPARGVLTDIDAQGATASFDGLDWSVPPWPVQPGLRNLTALTFDRARGKVVLFGGQPVGYGNPPPGCDLWELGDDGWTHVACSGTTAEPRARTNPVVGYDPVRRWTVVMAGYDGAGHALDDTWAWDGLAWRPLPPPPAGCPDRGLAWAEAAPGGGVFVGFTTLPGGTHGTCVGRWDGTGYTWSQPIAAFPADRSPTELTPDPSSNQLAALVIHDDAATSLQTHELWHWDAASSAGWKLAGVLPVPADVTAGGPLFGLAPLAWRPGQPSLQVIETTLSISAHYACSLEPFGCTPLAAQGFARPPGLFYGPLAFDTQGRGLMQGEPYLFGQLADFESWRWSSGTWSRDLTVPALFGAGIGTPEGSGETWLYGGALPGYPIDAGLSQDLWIGYPDGGWVVSGNDPNYQSYGLPWLASVPDAGLDGLVAAGWGGPAMWLHKQNGLLKADPLGPAGPQGYFAYDPVRARGVVTDFGGQVWEASPPAFAFQVVGVATLLDPLLVFDEGAGALLAIGGSPSVGVAPEGAVSRWDGQAMQPIPLSDPDDDGDPPPFFLRAAGWDRTTRRTRQVDAAPALGGSTTWELVLADSRPALVCQFRYAAAQAPQGQPLQVEVQATAGGPSGAALSLWQQGAWRESQRCTTSPCALHALVAGPDAVASLLADLRTLGVAVAPTQDNGTGLSTLDVASLQATLTYRLP